MTIRLGAAWVGDGFDLLDGGGEVVVGGSGRFGVVVGGGDGSWGWFAAGLAAVGPVEGKVAGGAFDPPACLVDQGVVIAPWE